MSNFWDKLKAVPDIIMDALLRTQREDTQSGEPYQALAEKYKDVKYAPAPGRPILRHVVIPKEFINTMPVKWRLDFMRLTGDLRAAAGYDALAHDFHIYRRDHQGRFEDFPDSKSMGMTTKEATDMADKLF